MLYLITFVYLVIFSGEAHALDIRPCLDMPPVINACVIVFLIGTMIPLATKLMLIHKVNRKTKNDLLLLVGLNALVYPVTLWLAYITWTKINIYLAWLRTPYMILEAPGEFSKKWQAALFYTIAFSLALLAEAYFYTKFFKLGKTLNRPFLSLFSCIAVGWLAGFAYFQGHRPDLGGVFYRPCNANGWADSCVDYLTVIGITVAITLGIRYMIIKYRKK